MYYPARSTAFESPSRVLRAAAAIRRLTHPPDLRSHSPKGSLGLTPLTGPLGAMRVAFIDPTGHPPVGPENPGRPHRKDQTMAPHLRQDSDHILRFYDDTHDEELLLLGGPEKVAVNLRQDGAYSPARSSTCRLRRSWPTGSPDGHVVHEPSRPTTSASGSSWPTSPDAPSAARPEVRLVLPGGGPAPCPARQRPLPPLRNQPHCQPLRDRPRRGQPVRPSACQPGRSHRTTSTTQRTSVRRSQGCLRLDVEI